MARVECYLIVKAARHISVMEVATGARGTTDGLNTTICPSYIKSSYQSTRKRQKQQGFLRFRGWDLRNGSFGGFYWLKQVIWPVQAQDVEK